MNCDIITYITRCYSAIGNSDRQPHVVVFQHCLLASAYADEAKKFIVSYLVGVELVSNIYIIPIVAVVAVFDQRFDFMRSQMPPWLLCPGELLVAEIPLVLSSWNIFLGNKTVADIVARKKLYVVHFSSPAITVWSFTYHICKPELAYNYA
jgi:hypothetical protein